MLSADEFARLERAVSRERARRQSSGAPDAAARALISAFGWRDAGDPGVLATLDGRHVLVRVSTNHGTFAAIPDPAGENYDLVACVMMRPETRTVARGVLVTRAEAAERGRVLACGAVELAADALTLGRGVHDITDALRRSAAQPVRGVTSGSSRPSPRALLRAQLAASLALSAAPGG